MAFDGRDHGIGALIPPYYHLPRAPALPDSLGQSLRHSYAVCRRAHLIGNQAQPVLHRDRFALDQVGSGIISTQFAGIARFAALDRPPESTHVLARSRFALLGGTGVQVRHRVQAFDGTTTVVGDALVDDLGDVDEPRAWFEPERFDSGLMLLGLGGLDSSSRIDVEVHAFAVDGAAAPLRYRAEIVSAWWLTIG